MRFCAAAALKHPILEEGDEGEVVCASPLLPSWISPVEGWAVPLLAPPEVPEEFAVDCPSRLSLRCTSDPELLKQRY